MKIKFWKGRLYWAVPPRLETPLTSFIRRLEQARASTVGRAVLEPPRRRAPAWRPAIVRTAPRSTPRPRARAQCSSPAGRDGSEARDDGGDGGDDGPGDGPPG